MECNFVGYGISMPREQKAGRYNGRRSCKNHIQSSLSFSYHFLMDILNSARTKSRRECAQLPQRRVYCKCRCKNIILIFSGNHT